MSMLSILFCCLLIVAGFMLFMYGFAHFIRKRRIENTPTSKIRSLALGPVEVAGTVSSFQGKILKSPFSKKDCLYYWYTIEEYRQVGKNRQWVTVKHNDVRIPFYISDSTGKVVVDPTKAIIPKSNVHEYNSSFGNEPPAEVKSFLQAMGLNHENFLGFNKTMRYKEDYIEPGTPMYIVGNAKQNTLVENPGSQNHEEQLMIAKGRDFYFIAYSEKEIIKAIGASAWSSIVFGTLMAVGSAVVLVIKYLN